MVQLTSISEGVIWHKSDSEKSSHVSVSGKLLNFGTQYSLGKFLVPNIHSFQLKPLVLGTAKLKNKPMALGIRRYFPGSKHLSISLGIYRDGCTQASRSAILQCFSLPIGS